MTAPADASGQRAVAHVTPGALPGSPPLWHNLDEHLLCVAALAEHAAQAFGAAEWAALAGRWHDLGKFRPGFQRYILQAVDVDAHIEGRVGGREKTHSAAGAVHAMRVFEQAFGAPGLLASRVLAYVIAGHHAGLADWTAGLDDRLLGTRREDAEREYTESVTICRQEDATLLELPVNFDLRTCFGRIPGIRPSDTTTPKLAVSLWVRMLFSALVDADFLDTEAFMNLDKASGRVGFMPIPTCLQRLDAHLFAKTAEVTAAGRADTPVMRARAKVLRQCRAKAVLPPGVFSLTVPTGGGKTLSSLTFALQHAVAHGKRRVIYAIPYTSIIEQTADVFGAIFGAANVVEHHSQAEATDTRESQRSRLACENWDAPLIVTTNVQLFESLFASRTSRCRKLHSIADSVIVLDEAQLLPPEFLQPILDALHVLVAHFGVTLLLCTATQPALTTRSGFDPRKAMRGLPPPTEIVDEPGALFESLERVTLRWPDNLDSVAEWPQLVPEIAARECVLAIVNTRADALSLTQALPEDTLHLSAAMCGAHRKQVIDTIRQRLQSRLEGDDTPLRVVSTQLVEAGVDIDFPVVYRALAGLDSIAQAAGRCNREGRLARGEVVVFVREVPRMLGQLRQASAATRSVHAMGLPNALVPEAFTRYFQRFYESMRSLDAKGIVADLTKEASTLKFAFRTAAEKFKLVDDEDQATLIVPYHLINGEHAQIEPLIEALKAGKTDRWLLRQVQRYTVNARKRWIEALQISGDVIEVTPGLYLLINPLMYGARFGLNQTGQPIDAISLIP